ncbi:MAG: hypothetical protein AAF631_02850 [Pseudomonadota bacterium]
MTRPARRKPADAAWRTIRFLGNRALRFAVIPLAMTLAFAPGSEAAPRMTLEAAENLCLERAIRFAEQPYGRFGEEPPPNRVRDQYRACVFANANRYPTREPAYRQSILRTLGVIR